MKEAIKRLRDWANRANPPSAALHKRATNMQRALNRIEKQQKNTKLEVMSFKVNDIEKKLEQIESEIYLLKQQMETDLDLDLLQKQYSEIEELEREREREREHLYKQLDDVV